MSVVLPRERDVILELGHVILDSTHHGMRVFPSSLVATVMLQCCRDGMPLTELIVRVEQLRDEIVARGGTVHWITGGCVCVTGGGVPLVCVCVSLVGVCHWCVCVCHW